MQKIIPKRSVGGATQHQPSRIVRPSTQIPFLHHHHAVSCHARPDMVHCPNIRIASTLENAGKIHQTQEQLTAFARP